MDRGKRGSKMHVLSDANGLPLLVGVSAVNAHDSEGLKPVVDPTIGSVGSDAGSYQRPMPESRR